MTRINVKVKAGEETEINGRGPVLGPSHLEELASRLAVLEEGDWVVLAGSLPAGLPDDTYARLLMPLTARGVRAVVDAEGAVLSAALTAHPFLIKPNRPELEALAGRALSTREELFDAARTLQEKGAANVLLSLGGEGAALLTSSGERLVLPRAPGQGSGYRGGRRFDGGGLFVRLADHRPVGGSPAHGGGSRQCLRIFSLDRPPGTSLGIVRQCSNMIQ